MALVLIGLGVVLATVAGAIRGKGSISLGELLYYVDHGGHIRNFGGWGITAGGDLLDELDKVDYDMEDISIFDSAYEIVTGNVPNSSLGSGIDRLEIEAGGCSLVFRASKDDEFYVEAENAGKFQCYVEDGTLYLKSLRKGSWNDKTYFDVNDVKKNRITLYIPLEASFEDVDIEIGAGIVEMSGFQTDRMELEVGAGQIVGNGIQAGKAELNVGAGFIGLEDMQAGRLSLETGMGSLEYSGSINEKAELNCSMGSVVMKVSGAEEDFNYDVECAMGSVVIGDWEYSGMAKEKKIDNRATKNMEIECSMGSVEILFE